MPLNNSSLQLREIVSSQQLMPSAVNESEIHHMAVLNCKCTYSHFCLISSTILNLFMYLFLVQKLYFTKHFLPPYLDASIVQLTTVQSSNSYN